MARPLRIEFEGAVYHITARGDRREAIYEDDADRLAFIDLFSRVISRHNWICHAYCLMSNHYHLIVETPQANLSDGMTRLNGEFAQASNRRHRRRGHVFQGRFTGIVVDKDSYLMELTRYVVLNPVRANMVVTPGDWPWSSYGAMIGEVLAPDWLSTDGLLLQFGDDRATARMGYREFVAAGVGAESIWSELRQQIYLGDDNFVTRVQAQADVSGDVLEVPRSQRRIPVLSLEAICDRFEDRDVAVAEAYKSGGYTYRQIGEFFEIHRSTVRRIARRLMVL